MSLYLDDQKVRLTAFQWLGKEVDLCGSEVLPRTLLMQGFELEDQRIPLMSQQGIFKPRVLQEIPLSITTTPSGPYDDQVKDDHIILYRYRGTDPQHPENIGLRTAMLRHTPLVYFYGIVPGQYMAIWPVFIVGDQPDALAFEVAVDDLSYSDYQDKTDSRVAEGRRSYITVGVQKRMHQHAFRERVLRAYGSRCALCRLRHRELLDAAHIVPDGEPGGEPIVPNGLSLCKLHHAAFDSYFLGIRPDYTIEVRQDVRDEDDGPMLTHGLQGLHDMRIWTPRHRDSKPSTVSLEWKYERFLRASV